MYLKKILSLEFFFVSCILFLLSFLLFYHLGKNYLSDWDEAWYADIARNIYLTGSLLTPIWNHRPFFDKPPLYFWLEAASFKLFGVNEWAARLPSALSGIGVCLMTYLLSKKLFSKKTALASLIVMASSVGFLYRARTGNLDVLLMFGLLLSWYGFYSKRWVVFGLGVASAFLTKGLVAFIFPGLVVIYWVVKCHPGFSSGSIKKILKRVQNDILTGILVAIGVPLVWFLLSYKVNGADFLNFFTHNQIGKITNSGDLLKSFSLDYIGYLRSAEKLWFIFFIPAFVLAIFRWKGERMLLWLFFVVYFLLLSVSENKSNWFLLPLLPIASMMIGDLVSAVNLLNKKVFVGVLAVFFALAVFQVYHYRSEFITADTVVDEAKVALAAKRIMPVSEPIYSTELDYPTTVFYSERQIFVTYGGGYTKDSWWVLPGYAWGDILQKKPIFIITTDTNIKTLEKYQDASNLQTIFQSGDRKLIKVN